MGPHVMRQPRSRSPRKPPPPLDTERLQALALRYVERYAVTEAKLLRYLARKIRERGWAEEKPADVDGIAARFAELGYVNDRMWSEAKSRSMAARGYGRRRVDMSLREAGVAEPLREDVSGKHDARAALDRFAQRKRIGPYALEAPDRDVERKQFAAALRAGHDFDLVKALFAAETAEEFLGAEE